MFVSKTLMIVDTTHDIVCIRYSLLIKIKCNTIIASHPLDIIKFLVIDYENDY